MCSVGHRPPKWDPKREHQIHVPMVSISMLVLTNLSNVNTTRDVICDHMSICKSSTPKLIISVLATTRTLCDCLCLRHHATCVCRFTPSLLTVYVVDITWRKTKVVLVKVVS